MTNKERKVERLECRKWKERKDQGRKEGKMKKICEKIKELKSNTKKRKIF